MPISSTFELRPQQDIYGNSSGHRLVRCIRGQAVHTWLLTDLDLIRLKKDLTDYLQEQDNLTVQRLTGELNAESP